MAEEKKDLTYASGRSKGKEIIRSDGTKEKVPIQFWRATILRDPMGATAQEAAKSKDPDLEKIKVDKIPIKSFLEVPVAEVKDKQVVLRPPVLLTSIFNVGVEEAKKMGFRSAESGKTRKK